MTNIQVEETSSPVFRFSISNENGEEVARARLHIIENDLHFEPYGLLEDVFVNEEARGQGHATTLVKEIIAKAKNLHCYKLVATSRTGRPKVHELYERLGFATHGIEFRMELI